jgi:hypothetical protein
MNRGTRQIIAEKVASTVRVLELLGLDYSVGAPKRTKVKGNKSPRVISVNTSSDGLILYLQRRERQYMGESRGRKAAARRKKH